ncbi:ATP adenylyltransferase [Metschnikowia aff. pulcherrima]|uniref:ATP adenylyltransferase n=1 Tax=Metschnikowia aff. pulcherrima TaxID=2163413 RepID=A0A4P6XRP2_9ASCO|nr:ATP adenylyltransferase [Metschnikowia aff. pulcherrima]
MQGLPTDFCKTLKSTYSTALAHGHLIYAGESAKSNSLNANINDSNYEFRLTVLESLQQRPEKGHVDLNPFDKPEPELTVVDTLGERDEFRIVLNKFPVVPAHFMLVTKSFKPQNSPLAPSELVATFMVLKKLACDADDDWFAFYNCGPSSGASQPHKHIQFMTLPQNHHPFAEKLAESNDHFIPSQKREALQDPNMPFAHFVARLPSEIDERLEEVLLLIFYALVQKVFDVLKNHDVDHISYNFCATTKYMMLVPRSNAKYEGTGINSCGFMGLVLCKDNKTAEQMKRCGFENVLAAIGFPNTSGENSNEYSY